MAPLPDAGPADIWTFIMFRRLMLIAWIGSHPAAGVSAAAGPSLMRFPPPFYRWRPHPWHGLEVGPDPPGLIHAYIELTPFDRVKYEVDKTTGYLRVDRPQRTSSLPPALYGFIPRTFCGRRVGAANPRSWWETSTHRLGRDR